MSFSKKVEEAEDRGASTEELIRMLRHGHELKKVCLKEIWKKENLK
jgi:hypothetical protein